MANSLKNIKLPDYSKGEEIFNMVTHIVGGAIGIAVLVLCVIQAAVNKTAIAIVSASIYGATMILLYTMSSIYHGLVHINAKKVFRVLDHCTIYLLIAGTYTPISLCAIREVNPATGWTVFGLQWGLCTLCLVLTAIDMKKYNALSMTCYVFMGWLVIFFIKPTMAALTKPGFMLVLLGGIMYSIGAVLYGIGKKKKYIHSVFHIFVLFGSVLQFFSIIFYVLR